jgi:hypothetical protein
MALELLRKARALFAPPPLPPQPKPAAAFTPAPKESRAFQLLGCRELVRAYPDVLPISSAIEIIERSIPTDPGLAFTHCRGLLETVCRTILTDRGVGTVADANSNQIMSATLKVLKLTPDEFDKDERVEAGVVDLVRGINQMVNGVVALRNSQGLGPHGRDALEAILDAEYAIITAQAIDSAACLLYRMHRKQAERDPLKRLRFGDYPEFDAFLDEEYPGIEIEETPIQASKALCLVEPEAYRQSLMTFLASPPTTTAQEEFAAGEELKEDANG